MAPSQRLSLMEREELNRMLAEASSGNGNSPRPL